MEDPLRVYRVARFASKFGYEVSEDTIESMREMKGELSTLSQERVIAELRKALLEEHPSRFFEVLKEADVLDVHFKEVADLIGVEQPVEYHPEGEEDRHVAVFSDKGKDDGGGDGYGQVSDYGECGDPSAVRSKDRGNNGDRRRHGADDTGQHALRHNPVVEKQVDQKVTADGKGKLEDQQPEVQRRGTQFAQVDGAEGEKQYGENDVGREECRLSAESVKYDSQQDGCREYVTTVFAELHRVILRVLRLRVQ